MNGQLTRPFLIVQFVLLCHGQQLTMPVGSNSSTIPSGIWNCKVVKYTEQCDGRYVQFYLYTRDGNEPVWVADGSSNITSTNYDDLRPNIIIAHGYDSDMNLDTLVAIRKEYLKQADYNIWVVDYPSLVKGPCYPFAVYNVPYIGRCISLLVRATRELSSASADPYFHVIGFSLGAHVAGRVGYEVRDDKVARVTGLDPAMPLFFSSNPGERLSKDDGKFVDVVHTNMFMQGHYSALGHVDFYMNGGMNQPGCKGGASERSGCDHHRAAEYFAESINSKTGFWGARCHNVLYVMMDRCPHQPPYEMMGDGARTSAQGLFYVRTRSEKPYAMGIINQSKKSILRNIYNKKSH
ncbi:Lipase [Nesidiocoris tenuis]|uniref:Lipase n=1 Tax=Nesidiocoris tenuis TaxID=355587 RepID=A0ABN7AR84_9HEMI|nr:Lipase [Nesidiocoris tenuis]